MIPDNAREWVINALAATPRPLWTIDDVERALDADLARLWLGEQSCIVTVIEDYTSGERVLDGWLAGGALDEIVTIGIPQIEVWATQAGCTQSIIDGRLGWVRALKGLGYEYRSTSIRKLLK